MSAVETTPAAPEQDIKADLAAGLGMTLQFAFLFASEGNRRHLATRVRAGDKPLRDVPCFVREGRVWALIGFEDGAPDLQIALDCWPWWAG